MSRKINQQNGAFRYARSLTFRSTLAGLGAACGWYLFGSVGDYFRFGASVVVAVIIGQTIGFLGSTYTAGPRFQSVRRLPGIFIGLVGVALVSIGIIAFAKTRAIIYLLIATFFGTSAVFAVSKEARPRISWLATALLSAAALGEYRIYHDLPMLLVSILFALCAIVLVVKRKEIRYLSS